MTHPMKRIRCYMGARLHRKLFAWFGVAIVMTTLMVSMSLRVVSGPERSMASERDRVERFVSRGFSRAWSDRAEREALARSYSEDLGIAVSVTDVRGGLVAQSAAWDATSCGPTWSFPVRASDGQRLGTVRMCFFRSRWHAAPWRTLVTLAAVGLVLWGISNKVARRLSHPLEELTRVARALGDGDLSCRANLCHTHPGEVGELTRAVNEMASRIERQLKEQRQLLAAVSHEMRTPLARIRILLEMARDGASAGPGRDPLDEIEVEVLEMDSLVGELLASARLEFSALTRRPLDARAVVVRAVDRANLPADRARVEPGTPAVDADPTLLARALGALIDNARKYGGPTITMRARAMGDDRVAFCVEDDGEGFSPGDEERVFEAFYRGRREGEADARGVGLGLALVRRIAEAHGGRAYAENRAEGGARVTLVIPRALREPAATESPTPSIEPSAPVAAE
jgi:two-component system OmpR family sensor kinase